MTWSVNSPARPVAGSTNGSPLKAQPRWARRAIANAASTSCSSEIGSDAAPPPEAKDALGDARLLAYQHFREDIADEWTRRQVAAIKAADPAALVREVESHFAAGVLDARAAAS